MFCVVNIIVCIIANNLFETSLLETSSIWQSNDENFNFLVRMCFLHRFCAFKQKYETVEKFIKVCYFFRNIMSWVKSDLSSCHIHSRIVS